MATRDFSKWRLSFAAGLCLLTGLRASAEDYAVGWYWLATSDTGKNNSSFTRANWLYEDAAGLGLSFPRTSPKVLLDQRENADGTVTFLLGYRRQGLILTYR